MNIREVLEAVVEEAIRPYSKNPQTKKTVLFQCIFCRQRGPLPFRITHKEGCLVVRGRRALILDNRQ